MRRRAAAMAAVVLGVLFATAPPAGAHVTIDPEEATQGRFAYLNLRVPNESNEQSAVQDGASTTQVEFNVPTDRPITVVQVEPTPGWDYELEMTELDEPIEQEQGEPITEVVSKITWSGGASGPTEFAAFEIVMGPLPEDVDELRFPTVQTYDSGEEVVWDEEDHDSEFPAPTLTLLPPDEHEAAMQAASGETPGHGPTVENTATQDDVDGANTLGIIGIVVGAVGIAFATFALLRSRTTGSPPAEAT
jgi:uncharacterized protein YcnI